MQIECSSSLPRPWSVVGWPPVAISAVEWGNMSRCLRPLGASVQGHESGMRCGTTLWAADLSAGVVGLAFEWTEVNRGILALADPWAILSNAIITADDSRVPVDESARVLHLNGTVHALSWQHQVLLLCANQSPFDLPSPTLQGALSLTD